MAVLVVVPVVVLLTVLFEDMPFLEPGPQGEYMLLKVSSSERWVLLMLFDFKTDVDGR